MAAMRDLLVHHVDDLDDIMDKLQHGTCEYANTPCSSSCRQHCLGKYVDLDDIMNMVQHGT